MLPNKKKRIFWNHTISNWSRYPVILLFMIACSNPISDLDIINGSVSNKEDKARIHTVKLIVTGETPENGGSKFTSCSGSLITRRHILTAAHCVKSAISVQVLFYPNNWSEHNKAEVIEASSFKAHPEYSKNAFKNDIGVILLSEPAPSAFIPTQIGQKEYLKESQPVLEAGYGITLTEDDSNSHRPLRVAENTISRVSNYQNLPNTAEHQIIEIRSGLSLARPLTCSGDSGGPLFVRDELGDLRQIGITSNGDKDCRYSSRFMGVLSFWHWVEQTIKEMTKDLSTISITTELTSDENSFATKALCTKNTALTGFHCDGRYCDDIAITCSGNLYKTDGFERWSNDFSEEGENKMICPDNKFVSGLRCQGRYCDSISLQCAKFEGLNQNQCYWSHWVSEEEKSLIPPLGSYIAGMECGGSFCDNKRAYICQSSEVWTAYNSEEDSDLPKSICPEGRYAAGFSCQGKYCDNIAIRCEEHKDIKQKASSIKWTPHFSEENIATEMCENDQIISALRCEGRYCDKLSLGCQEFSGINRDECFWTDVFSEENGGRLDLPNGYGAVGIKCYGRYCDEKRLWACRLHN